MKSRENLLTNIAALQLDSKSMNENKTNIIFKKETQENTDRKKHRKRIHWFLVIISNSVLEWPHYARPLGRTTQLCHYACDSLQIMTRSRSPDLSAAVYFFSFVVFIGHAHSLSTSIRHSSNEHIQCPETETERKQPGKEDFLENQQELIRICTCSFLIFGVIDGGSVSLFYWRSTSAAGLSDCLLCSQ